MRYYPDGDPGKQENVLKIDPRTGKYIMFPWQTPERVLKIDPGTGKYIIGPRNVRKGPNGVSGRRL